MDRIGRDHFASLLRSGNSFLDVRAPVEFAEGSIPGAVNVPILTDDERARVGTTYKIQGSSAAIALGYELVRGTVKDLRVKRWAEEIVRAPDSMIYCFRGGLRSQLSQQWLAEMGVQRPVIEGGYKALRNFLLETLDREATQRDFVVVGGATGSGKTDFLREIKVGALDLEKRAHHRGSAFGGMPTPQPTQVDFENAVAVDLMRLDARLVLVEDESRMIGQRVVPEKLFFRLKESPMILLQEPLGDRLSRLMVDYVLRTPIADDDEREVRSVYEKYRLATQAISSKLGGLRTAEIFHDLTTSQDERLKSGTFDSNREWIRKLLEWYYDPMYEKGLQKREGEIVFRGTSSEALDWWRSRTP